MTELYADVASFRNDALSFLIDRGEKATEPLVPLAFGPDPVYLLTDPDYVKPLLKISEEVVDKGPMVNTFREVTGNNIVVLHGPEHRRRRAVLNSFVGRPAVEPLAPVLASEIRKALAEVAIGRTFDARYLGARIAMRIICVVTFGANVLSVEDEQMLFDNLEDVLSDLTDKIFGPPEVARSTEVERNQRLAQAKRCMQLVVQHVQERRPEAPIIRGYGELDLSEQDTADELLTLLIVGHETTGSAASWLTHTLATVPGLADAIAAESAVVRDETGEIDVRKLPLAKATMTAVQEILRLYPSAWWTARGTREEIEFAGRQLSKGTSIVVSPWLFHRCARFWDAPNEFRLGREYLKTNAYIPFGTGPRICVGLTLAMLELQIIALEMASAFELVPAGPIGGPRPLIHLLPPSIPMEARPRVMTQVKQQRQTGLDVGSQTYADQFPSQCPFHAQAMAQKG